MSFKVSVVIGAKNEWPVILGTIYSAAEELNHWGYPFEIVVVDNGSTDLTSEALEDKMRRWIKLGLLKVVRWNERPANVMVRNIGAEAATGDFVVFADAHVSFKIGTLRGMIEGWKKVGGLWHSATNIWGDTSNIRCYGYDLKLQEKFWGNLCHGLPDPIKSQTPRPAYLVPMASHCCVAAGRREYLEKHGYHPLFRCYGGGEPYLDLRWWMLGGEVWIYPEGLVRHAFGVNVSWRTAGEDRDLGHSSYVKGRGTASSVKAGEQFIHLSRGYAWNNEQLHHNFLLSAYVVGGYQWLKRIYDVYWNQRKINSRYLEDLNEIRREVLAEGQEERTWLQEHQKLSLDELLERSPWTDFSRSFTI